MPLHLNASMQPCRCTRGKGMKPGTSQQEQQVYEDKQVEVYQERQELLE